MKFYTGRMFPQKYKNQIFIAEHGSWNRSTPIGYRVTLVELEEGRAASYKVFASGWLQGERAWGRPVDILIMPDGAMLVSDDRAGVIADRDVLALSLDRRAEVACAQGLCEPSGIGAA